MTELKKRKLKQRVAISLSTLAAIMGIFWLIFILVDILRNGIAYIKPSLFLNDPVPPGFAGGGLRNAFVGQLLLTGVATIIGIPISIITEGFI